ncbi:MAG: hypothetical protein BGO05_05190 [Rhizobiales bacterium 63-7]|nr:hypothetical protein [Hyphomicrobiales bacterium]OJU66600.1 MAG: hypothetical protein BGO05_05190 [Rhizobiales bacterium 63-7]
MAEDWIDGLPVVRMTPCEFEALPEYSASYPTGTTPGKRWRREDGAFDPGFIRKGGRPRWVIGEYDPNCPPGAKRIRINWYRPVLRVKAGRMIVENDS